MGARLFCSYGEHAGLSLDCSPTVGEQVTIGREPNCDLVLDSEGVSNRHARIFWDGDQPFLEDLNSLNGTDVDGERIRRPFRLGELHVLTLGRSGDFFFVRPQSPKRQSRPEPSERVSESSLPAPSPDQVNEAVPNVAEGVSSADDDVTQDEPVSPVLPRGAFDVPSGSEPPFDPTLDEQPAVVMPRVLREASHVAAPEVRTGMALATTIEETRQLLPISEGRNRVGRDPGCEIRIEDNRISRYHAEVHLAGDTLTVRDLESTNGSFIDDDRLDPSQTIRVSPGQILRLGDLELRIVTHEETALEEPR